MAVSACDRRPGTVNLAAGQPVCGMQLDWVGGRDDDTCLPEPRQLPLPSRGHQPRCVAVFPLPTQLRMVDGLLAARGILIGHETVRQWVQEFGQGNRVNRRRGFRCEVK